MIMSPAGPTRPGRPHGRQTSDKTYRNKPNTISNTSRAASPGDRRGRSRSSDLLRRPDKALAQTKQDRERGTRSMWWSPTATWPPPSRRLAALLGAHDRGRVVAEVVQQPDRRVGPGGPGDGPAGVGGPAGLVQAGDGHPVRGPARRRAQRP